jgi:hypothetical protein
MNLTELNTKNDVANEFVSLVNQGNNIVTQLSQLKNVLLALRTVVTDSELFTEEEVTEVTTAINTLASDIKNVVS